MSIGFSKYPPPSKLPEHVLWTLAKDSRRAEARVRMTPLGPELRFLMWRDKERAEDIDLLWSQIYRAEDGGSRMLGEVADQKRRQFQALGWTFERVTDFTTDAPH